MKKPYFLLAVSAVIISLFCMTSCNHFLSPDTNVLGGWEYFPHALGNSWYYKNVITTVTATAEFSGTPKYTTVSFSGTKTLGTYEAQISHFNGRTDFSEIATFWPICFPSVQTASSLEGYYCFTDSDVLQIKSTPTREVFGIVYALPKFPIEKVRWETYGWTPENPHELLATAEVIGKETVTVAAGVFNDCIKISYQDEFYVWLAPNVGLVKTTFAISVEAGGGHGTISTTELVSKNF